MARVFTYSFEDTTFVISHPLFETYSAYGTGIGQVGVQYNTDNSSHTISADKTIVVNKVTVHDGKLNLSIIQSSDFNKFLRRWADFIESNDTANFALTTVDITNRSTGVSYHCSGVTHQKRGDEDYQSTAQNVNWTLLCADISSGAI